MRRNRKLIIDSCDSCGCSYFIVDGRKIRYFCQLQSIQQGTASVELSTDEYKHIPEWCPFPETDDKITIGA